MTTNTLSTRAAEVIGQADIILNSVKSHVSTLQIDDKIKHSVHWFLDKLKDLKKKQQPIEADTRPVPGHFYLFQYNAKHDKTLSYWDQYPLVMPLHYYEDGFLGLNFHYMTLIQRAMMVKYLSQHYIQSSNERQYIAATWNDLKDITYSKKKNPLHRSVKRYLFSQMQTKVMRIPPSEWGLAMTLPIQKWHGNPPGFLII